MTEEQLDIIYARFMEGTATEEEINLLKESGDFDALELIKHNTSLWEINEPVPAFNATPKVEKKSSSRRFLYMAASIVLIIGLSGFFYMRYFDVTTYESLASTQEIVLPDGSKVMLDKNSTLSHASYGWLNERTLELDGHAFFDVESGSKFIVKTSQGDVEVLGTEFDVLEDDNQLLVRCFEGSVQITTPNNQTVIKENEGYSVTTSEETRSFKLNQEKVEWMNTEAIFDEIALTDVVAILSAKHDVDITFAKSVKLSDTYSGKLPLADLEAALTLICNTLDYTYSRDNGTIEIE